MICPYCDSQLRQLTGNGTCPNCGAPLGHAFIRQEQEKTEKRFPDPPLGVYHNPRGDHMELTENAVVFRQKIGPNGSLVPVEVIPYSEVSRVTIAPGGSVIAGYLSVRGRKDKHIRLPKSTWEAAGDHASFCFGRAKYRTFYDIYLFLKQCADIVNAAEK